MSDLTPIHASNTTLLLPNSLSSDASALADKPPSETAKTSIVPVPQYALPMWYLHPDHGKPSGAWPYHDDTGELIGYKCRWDITKDDGAPGKTYLPVRYLDLGDGRGAWRASGFPKPHALYRLPGLKASPDATILVTEGEKACDAAAQHFPELVTTTSPNGAKAADKADWEPVIGRKVIIWRDNDDEGREYEKDVARLAQVAGATSVSVVDVPESFPNKWDLADPAPDGCAATDLAALLANARPFVSKSGNTGAAINVINKDIPDRFRLSKDGVLFRPNKESAWEPVCSRLEVAAWILANGSFLASRPAYRFAMSKKPIWPMAGPPVPDSHRPDFTRSQPSHGIFRGALRHVLCHVAQSRPVIRGCIPDVGTLGIRSVTGRRHPH